MGVTIYHNPRCSKSRRTLELLEGRGLEVTVVEYLSDPPDAATLADLLDRLGKAPRELLRRKEPAYRELGLDAPGLGREALIAAMVAHPILIERPIVVAGAKAALGRPPEAVLEILDRPDPVPLTAPPGISGSVAACLGAPARGDNRLKMWRRHSRGDEPGGTTQ